MTATGLASGETCTYRVSASCGGPGFKVESTTTAADDAYSVTYIAFNEQSSGTNEVSVASTSLVDRSNMAAAPGLPPRNYMVKSKLVVADREATSGNYNEVTKGFAVFGAPMQNTDMGFSTTGRAECEPRDMLVTVVALSDFGTKFVNLDFKSFTLTSNPNGATLLTGAVSLALVSLSLF